MPAISTNNAATAALNYLNQNSAQQTSDLARLASGSKIVKASDDPAGLAIGTQLQASSAVYQQDATNVQQGASILQIADGALAQISDILQRMMMLATEAASGQVTNTQRTQDVGTEYGQLLSEIDSIATSTKYAGQAVLGAFANTDFLVGTSSTDTVGITTTAVTAAGLGLTAGDLNTATAAATAIDTINAAIGTITRQRAWIGAYESQFNFSGLGLAANIAETQASTSVIMDADIAADYAEQVALDVLIQAAIAALSQASRLPQELLNLIDPPAAGSDNQSPHAVQKIGAADGAPASK